MTEQEYKNLKEINESGKFQVLFSFCDALSYVEFNDDQIMLIPNYTKRYSTYLFEDFEIISNERFTIEQALKVLRMDSVTQKEIEEVEKEIAYQNKLFVAKGYEILPLLYLINDDDESSSEVTQGYKDTLEALRSEQDSILEHIKELKQILNNI